MDKVQLDKAILSDQKDNHIRWAKVKEKDTKENNHRMCVTDVDNLDTLQNIAEFQYTTMEKHHKQQQNDMIIRWQWFEGPYAYDGCWWNNNMGHNGQDMQQQSQQLALRAPHATASADNAPTIQIVSEYIVKNQLWLHMFMTASQGNNQPTLTLWWTLEQPRMFAHHGSHKSFPYNPYQQTMDHNKRTVTNNEIKLYMDTSGILCTMQKDNQSSYHSMCVPYTNQLYQAQGWKNKVSSLHSMKNKDW